MDSSYFMKIKPNLEEEIRSIYEEGILDLVMDGSIDFGDFCESPEDVKKLYEAFNLIHRFRDSLINVI